MQDNQRELPVFGGIHLQAEINQLKQELQKSQARILALENQNQMLQNDLKQEKQKNLELMASPPKPFDRGFSPLTSLPASSPTQAISPNSVSSIPEQLDFSSDTEELGSEDEVSTESPVSPDSKTKSSEPEYRWLFNEAPILHPYTPETARDLKDTMVKLYQPVPPAEYIRYDETSPSPGQPLIFNLNPMFWPRIPMGYQWFQDEKHLPILRKYSGIKQQTAIEVVVYGPNPANQVNFLTLFDGVPVQSYTNIRNTPYNYKRKTKLVAYSTKNRTLQASHCTDHSDTIEGYSCISIVNFIPKNGQQNTLYLIIDTIKKAVTVQPYDYKLATIYHEPHYSRLLDVLGTQPKTPITTPALVITITAIFGLSALKEGKQISTHDPRNYIPEHEMWNKIIRNHYVNRLIPVGGGYCQHIYYDDRHPFVFKSTQKITQISQGRRQTIELPQGVYFSEIDGERKVFLKTLDVNRSCGLFGDIKKAGIEDKQVGQYRKGIEAFTLPPCAAFPSALYYSPAWTCDILDSTLLRYQNNINQLQTNPIIIGADEKNPRKKKYLFSRAERAAFITLYYAAEYEYRSPHYKLHLALKCAASGDDYHAQLYLERATQHLKIIENRIDRTFEADFPVISQSSFNLFRRLCKQNATLDKDDRYQEIWSRAASKS